MNHLLPDSILYTDNRRCYLAPVTRVANNVKDFQERYADKFNVGDCSATYSLVDTFSDDVRWAYLQMERFNRSISYSEIQCFNYNLQLHSLESGNVKLAKWFIDEVEALPLRLDGESIQNYFDFFDSYGDHVYTRCSMGGLIN